MIQTYASYDIDTLLKTTHSWAVPFAKGFGMMLNFNCALVFLPVCRNALSWYGTFRIRIAVNIFQASGDPSERLFAN